MYERYGRDRAAQVANVITYRPRSALREMAKAAGVAPGQADALGKWVDRWAAGPEAFGELTDQELPDHRQVTPRNERRMERSMRDRTRDGVALDGPAATTRPPAIPPPALELASAAAHCPRRLGEEEVKYTHPLTKPSLKKTLGVPLFQEQLMQLAVDCAGFSAAEADQLRQAMGSKRSQARMERMRARLLAGMAERGITGDTAEQIYTKLEAFSSFGFPESHSVSFAYLVYASSWIKYHYPAEFAAALLNAQPMGFYSPHTIVRDARRHGVQVLGPDLNASCRDATLEPRSLADEPIGRPLRGFHAEPSHLAIRLGLRSVRGLHDALLDRIDDERVVRTFTHLEDFVRRTRATVDQVEALATAGAFEHCFGQSRRSALWAAGALGTARPNVRRDGSVRETLPGVVTGTDAPALPGMTEMETAHADLWAMGISVGKHPTEFVREE